MSTHHGFINEFPWIRIDAFDKARKRPGTPAGEPGRPAHVYLLTHAHTDHIVGLDAKGFSGIIYMTAPTKQILLETATASERVMWEERGQSSKLKRKFDNLRERKGRASQAGPPTGRQYKGSDSIRTVSLNAPFEVTGPSQEVVRVTALDANHCIGSCMYLIEGTVQGVEQAVLVTGDIRAETWWTTALRHNPLVSKYVHWPNRDHMKADDQVVEQITGRSRLDCIYIDTSSIVDEELVSKASQSEAVDEVCRYMARYPPETRFFLNCWTYGYEELLKGVHTAFGEMIHLDWHKERIYCSSVVKNADPLLAEAGTSVAPASGIPPRFHACERRWKCDHVWGQGVGCFLWGDTPASALRGPKKLKRPGVDVTPGLGDGVDPAIVYVNPLEMPVWQWQGYKKKLDQTLELVDRKNEGEKLTAEEEALAVLPDYLITPLARHSTLPELQRLVEIFRPKTLYPLTMDVKPGEPCVLYPALASCFPHQLDEDARNRLAQEGLQYRQQHLQYGHIDQVKLSFEAAEILAMQDLQELSEIHGYIVDRKNQNRLLSAATINVEGSSEVVKTINSWLTIKKGEEFPPLSPVRVGQAALRRQQGKTLEAQGSNLSASTDSDRPARASVEPSKRQLTFDEESGGSHELVGLDDDGDGDDDADMPPVMKARAHAFGSSLLPALNIGCESGDVAHCIQLGPLQPETRARPPPQVVINPEPTAIYSRVASSSSIDSLDDRRSKKIKTRPTKEGKPHRLEMLSRMLGELGNRRVDRDGSVIPWADTELARTLADIEEDKEDANELFKQRGSNKGRAKHCVLPDVESIEGSAEL
ncbi:hypothetical protein OIO90_001457 [Microbotryomycetes sp. JL221]|nr:hypothetical protein OIO90_001457 [Microbotryomycetes sp. JL221]